MGSSPIRAQLSYGIEKPYLKMNTIYIYICIYVYIYAIMKTVCPPGYHHNGFVATHALKHMMYGLMHIYIHNLYMLRILNTLKQKHTNHQY